MRYLQQFSRWTAFSCLFTHPNVKGPHFFRRVASLRRIKVPQVLTYKEVNPIKRTPLLQRNGVPGTPFLQSPAQTLFRDEIVLQISGFPRFWGHFHHFVTSQICNKILGGRGWPFVNVYSHHYDQMDVKLLNKYLIYCLNH